MLGKVHGPYLAEDKHQFVIIIKHNPDGSILSRKSISYNRYQQEREEGLHNYSAPPKKEKKIPEQNLVKPVKEEFSVICENCCNEFQSARLITKFCSKRCASTRQRWLTKMSKNIAFTDQVVIPVNGLNKEDDKYYIVIDLKRNEKDHRFVKQEYCKIINGVNYKDDPIRYLEYDYSKSVEIRTSYLKDLFWITEDAVLVSKRTKKILSQTILKNGYLTHSTKINGRNGDSICFRIHRMVAYAFVANTNSLLKDQVNHKNGIKTNNHYTNLEWVTSQENSEHAYSTGLAKGVMGTDNTSSKLIEDSVRNIRASKGTVTARELGNRYGVNHSIIVDVWNYKSYKNVK